MDGPLTPRVTGLQESCWAQQRHPCCRVDSQARLDRRPRVHAPATAACTLHLAPAPAHTADRPALPAPVCSLHLLPAPDKRHHCVTSYFVPYLHLANCAPPSRLCIAPFLLRTSGHCTRPDRLLATASYWSRLCSAAPPTDISLQVPTFTTLPTFACPSTPLPSYTPPPSSPPL